VVREWFQRSLNSGIIAAMAHDPRVDDIGF